MVARTFDEHQRIHVANGSTDPYVFQVGVVKLREEYIVEMSVSSVILLAVVVVWYLYEVR